MSTGAKVIIRHPKKPGRPPKYLVVLMVLSSLVLVPALALFSLKTARDWQTLQLFYTSWSKCMSAGQQALDDAHYEQGELLINRALKSAREDKSAGKDAHVQISLMVLSDLYGTWDRPKQADAARQQLKQLQDARVSRLQEEAKELQKNLTDVTTSGEKDKALKEQRILSTVKAITQVAHQYVALSHLSMAEELVQSTLEKLDDTAGPYDESLGITFLTLAELFNLEGEDSRAGPFFQQAADIFQRASMTRRDAADFANSLATWYYQKKDMQKAITYADRALYLRRGPDDSKELGDAYLLCAKVNQGLKDRRLAPIVQQFERMAAETYKRLGSADGIAECRLIAAARMDLLENTRMADQLTIDALRAAEATEQVSMPMLVPSLRTLGDRYVSQKQFEKAEPLLKRAIAHLELEPEKNSRQMADTLTTLAQLYSMTNRAELAESLRYQIDMLQTKIP